jgi:hypothetical protein
MQKRTILAVTLSAVATLASAPGAASQEPNFGRAVAMTGADLLIGQPVNWYGPGTVYAYRPDASGEWAERSMLTASDSARMDDFGRALALDGNTLVVGAPRKRDGSGVAYVFERSGPEGSWAETRVLEPPRGGDHADYAAALALSGDDLLVGSPAVDGTGVVYHFRRDGGDWGLHGTIRPPAADGT